MGPAGISLPPLNEEMETQRLNVTLNETAHSNIDCWFKKCKLHFKSMYFNYSTIEILNKALHLNADKWFPWQPLWYSSHMLFSWYVTFNSQGAKVLEQLLVVCHSHCASNSSCLSQSGFGIMALCRQLKGGELAVLVAICSRHT